MSLGSNGILAGEIRSALALENRALPVYGFIVGLGGRDVPHLWLQRIHERLSGPPADGIWADLREDLLEEEQAEAWRQQWESGISVS